MSPTLRKLQKLLAQRGTQLDSHVAISREMARRIIAEALELERQIRTFEQRQP